METKSESHQQQQQQHKSAQTRAPRCPPAQLELSDVALHPPCHHSLFPPMVPALMSVSASLSHRPAQGCFQVLQLRGLFLPPARVCRLLPTRPQFEIHLFSFFLFRISQPIWRWLGQLSPLIRSSYLQALGSQQPACSTVSLRSGRIFEKNKKKIEHGRYPMNSNKRQDPPRPPAVSSWARCRDTLPRACACA